ncbi:MAG: hypothetical protein EBZ36_02775 [Acidobacteria bacterium]|nr:hypothetical protein [Acidobacteriota bacterium]
MKRRVSEFAYGFVLTHELVGTHGWLRVTEPVEGVRGRAGRSKPEPRTGYPVFIQFKASEYLKRRNAGESKLVGLPYFRFAIHRKTQSPHQELLMGLARKGRLVYYATPKIHEAVNLNSAFFDHKIVAGSLFVPPAEIGELPDNEAHRVVFSGRHDHVYLCPEGRRLEQAVHGEGFMARVRELTSDREPERLDEAFYLHLATDMLSLVSPNRRIFDELSRGKLAMSAATFTNYLARTLLDCELLIVPATPASGDGAPEGETGTR